AEQKAAILSQFEEKFSMDSRAATELLGSTTHLLGAPQVIGAQLDGVASRNKETFDSKQAESLIEMIETTATIGGAMSDLQREYADGLRSMFITPGKNGTWT
ncbi:MAG: hypothetical protein OEM25_00215, partial [Gammaproteobacteria bacterium]|nr:hypothetical protein [Gammaproteobacteria bacterium]